MRTRGHSPGLNGRHWRRGPLNALRRRPLFGYAVIAPDGNGLNNGTPTIVGVFSCTAIAFVPVVCEAYLSIRENKHGIKGMGGAS